jgi:hypothetical protein
MNSDLINKVESLKVMLISRAIGGGGDDLQYKNLRLELIELPHIKNHLPKVVHICRDLAQFWSFIKPKFKTYAERTEYLRGEFEPLLHMLESGSRSPSDSAISATIQAAGLSYVHEAWQKALERRNTDVEGAITAARTLVESVCKHVLDSAEEKYDDAAELPKLYALTAKHLNLSPSQHTEQLFKQILGGCQTVAEGLGAMRNRYSDAHGKGPAAAKPAPRHAELAVNLSGAMATFLLQTWEAKQK